MKLRNRTIHHQMVSSADKNCIMRYYSIHFWQFLMHCFHYEYHIISEIMILETLKCYCIISYHIMPVQALAGISNCVNAVRLVELHIVGTGKLHRVMWSGQRALIQFKPYLIDNKGALEKD